MIYVIDNCGLKVVLLKDYVEREFKKEREAFYVH